MRLIICNGSVRGLGQLIDELKKADPLALDRLETSESSKVGRAKELNP